MRILWLTPVHRHSAIARFSELVVERLIAEGCQVTVAAAEASFDPEDRRPFGGLPIAAARRGPTDFDAFDIVIANFGDHFPNHAQALDALACPLTVGIFHDADMTNFGNGMRAAGLSPLRESGDWPSGRDVTASIAGRCAGAVAHSRFYLPAVDSCDGPIAAIPLAWAPPEALRGERPGTRSPGPKFRLVTFGHINPNKCADRVIEAIAGSPRLRSAVEYRLVGPIEPAIEASLTGLAEGSGVRLVVRGRVSDDELIDELAEASAVSCLRDPVLEGASASAIEAMMQGCAVIVSDAGFYAELPDDCVAKVPAGTDAAAIRAALESLYTRPGESHAMGRRARAYSLSTFTPKNYARALLELIDDVHVSAAYQPLIGRLAAQLAGLGVSPEAGATGLILHALEAMAPVSRRDSSHVDGGAPTEVSDAHLGSPA